MTRIKQKLEERVLGENCSLNTYVTFDGAEYVLEINYLNGKFTSEKTFPCNSSGLERMEELRGMYKNEEDIKRYFNLAI